MMYCCDNYAIAPLHAQHRKNKEQEKIILQVPGILRRRVNFCGVKCCLFS